MKRAVDLSQGIACVVTDLHGQWEPYTRYRDHFLALHEQGEADSLIFLGDVIHGYGPPEEDASLSILWDIMQLQAELGSRTVILLLGNHELPHIYGVTLAKGEINFTARFEHALGEYREPVIAFLKSLPFAVRTAGGVMMTHAGAAPGTATPEAAQRLLDFSHQALLEEADRLLAQQEAEKLIRDALGLDPGEYEEMARYHLAVSGPNDPRYNDLLRGFVVTNLKPEWPLLWDFFFTQCEAGLLPSAYSNILARFLEVYSPPEMPQRVLVTGHIPVSDGYAIIAGQQLRLASWAHAIPQESGCYLLFDVAAPIENARQLLPFVHRIPGSEW